MISHSSLNRAELNYGNKRMNKSNVDRQLLYDHWATWKCVLKFQPINDIENYFGTKVAFFFSWLGMYSNKNISNCIK